MSRAPYGLQDGTPCDDLGRPLRTRAVYSRGTTSYNQGAQSPGSWPPQADQSRISERTTRGYNPSYYGEVASRTGSRPPMGDPGYTVEKKDAPEGSPMNLGFHKYKDFDDEAHAYQDEYTKQRNAIPVVRKSRRTEPYYGEPSMTSTSHGQLLQPAANYANTARMAQELRGNFDKDYVGHYPHNASRRGHLKREDNLRKSANDARRWEDEHREYSN